MAQTLAESVSPDPEEHKQILRVWMVGLFNAASFAAAAGAGAG